jgi:hypothetical protein
MAKKDRPEQAHERLHELMEAMAKASEKAWKSFIKQLG